MTAKEWEKITTPVPDEVSEGMAVFRCADCGHEVRSFVPDPGREREVYRENFARTGWIRLGENQYCQDHAPQAVADQLSLMMCRERPK